MVPYPGIQLFHEALVGVGLVIVNRSERDTRDEETGAENEEEGGKVGRERWRKRENCQNC